MKCYFCRKTQRGRMGKVTIEEWVSTYFGREIEPERDWRDVYACKKCIKERKRISKGIYKGVS